LRERALSPLVAGVDVSEVTVRQASRRNQWLIRNGRVALSRASVSVLPYEDARFSKACAINSFHHWPEPEEGLRETRRVLRTGGILMLGLRLEQPKPRRFAAPGYSPAEIDRIQTLLRRVGFHHGRTEFVRAGREVAFVIASR
jgi:ubiquinone/menaquinone biosynthesis C-methylase UbiE